MSLTKELIEQERQLVQTGRCHELHLHREGTFLRAYDWSAWLCCRYLHDFKVSKRTFKGIDTPATLTSIMQRILAFPIESKSPLESMTFLADIKQRLASLI